MARRAELYNKNNKEYTPRYDERTLQGKSKALSRDFKKKLSFKYISPFDKKYADFICEILDTAMLYTSEERVIWAELLTEDYREQTDRNMPPIFLETLGTYLLADYYLNKNTAKAQHEDYSLLTERQSRRRSKKETLTDDDSTLDYFANDEKYSLSSRIKIQEKSVNK
jgi:hypothetical protein